MKLGSKTSTGHIHQLGSKQAAAFAGLERDALCLGLFFLAERQELTGVGQALAAARENPHVALWQERLAPLARAAQQEAALEAAAGLKAEAAKAWARIRAAGDSKLDKTTGQRLQAALDAFEKKYGALGLPQSVRHEIAALRTEVETVAKGFKELFNGRTLAGWKVVRRYSVAIVGQPNSGVGGDVRVEDGQIILETGRPETGIKRLGPVPPENYELEVDVRSIGKLDLSIIFPVGNSPCVLKMHEGNGGTALLAIEGYTDPEGVTRTGMQFERGRWYRARIRVTASAVEAWLDDKKLVSLKRAGVVFNIHLTWQPIMPLGIGSWMSSGAVRRVAIRELPKDRRR